MVLKVVPHVELSHKSAKPSAWTVVVHVEVEHVVDQVARQEAAAKHHPRPGRQYGPEEQQEDGGKGNACSGWHHEAQWVVWMIVVNPVDHEVETMGPLAVRVEVKNDSVEPVLGKRPKEPAAGKPDNRAQASVGGTHHSKDCNGGDEDHQHH